MINLIWWATLFVPLFKYQKPMQILRNYANAMNLAERERTLSLWYLVAVADEIIRHLFLSSLCSRVFFLTIGRRRCF